MTIDRKPSSTAKAGLTTGIIGTSLGALNLLGHGAGLLGNMVANSYPATVCPTVPVCNEDHLVDRYTLELEAKLLEKDSQLALRDANTFTDQKMLEMYKYIDGELRSIRDSLSAQAVHNQKTADSFQMVSERVNCCCNELNTKIEAERHERCCADNAIVNYVNTTFYPKMVADVTTGTTTTAQTLFNPLPAENCGCNPCG